MGLIDVPKWFGRGRHAGGDVTNADVDSGQIQKAIFKCTFRRLLPIPIGTFLVGIISVPVTLVYFPATTFRSVPQIVWGIQRLNHSKYKFYMKDCKKCTSLKFLHWYSPWYLLLTPLLLLIILPLLLVLVLLLGVLHATYAAAKRTYTESDMFDEAKSGSYLDRVGLFEASKEKMAEAMAKWPCGLGLAAMFLGDWFTLTGMVEGFKRIEEVRYLHDTCLGVSSTLINVTVWAEDTFHVLPIRKILNDSRKKAVSTMDEHKKKMADEYKSKQEGQAKTPPVKMGVLVGVVSLLVGLVFWPALYVLAV